MIAVAQPKRMGRALDAYFGVFVSHPPETLAVVLNVLLAAGTIYFWRRISWRYRVLCLVVGVAGIYIGLSELALQASQIGP